LWSILSGILFYSAWVEDPNLLPFIYCMVFAPTGTEGAEDQGTEGRNWRLGSQEKWKEMSLATFSVLCFTICDCNGATYCVLCFAMLQLVA